MRFVLVALISLVFSACDSVNDSLVQTGAQSPDSGVSPRSTMSEAKFRAGMAVEDVKYVSYEDESGNAIPFEEFISIVTSGRAFSKTVSLEASTATFSVDAVSSDERTSAIASNLRLKVPLASMVPAIDGVDLDGNAHILGNGSTYTLLSFFFSECVPCIQEVPEMNELSEGRAGLEVLAITFDSKGEAATFVEKYGLRVPVIAEAQAYIDALGISVYPTLVLVSPEGRLVATKSSRGSSASSDSIDAWLQSLGV